MASSSSSLPASSSSSSSSASFSYSQRKYDVFLSLHGQDIRKSFTDHLFVALLDKGIHAFKVEPGLERGKPIEDILKAIQESRFSIVIFSANFAFSTWCLEELATIVECVEEGRQKVFPSFYHVDPSEVQQVTGRYEEAFRGHEEGFRNDINKVSRWRDAMKRVANVSGWHLKNKRESKFIQGIVKEIQNQLSCTQRINIDLKDLVGMESRVMDISAYLAIQPSDDDAIRTIGIFGMGGIGKSTIARVVYTNFAHQFQASSFIENIGVAERNLGTVAHLQEQLLCDILKERDQSVRTTYEREKEIRTRLRRNRAPIVLDDVTHLKQLELLAGDRYWFGSGSRIIITTRDKHLLDCYGVDKEYKVELLNHYEALELFCKKAFPNGSHSEDHEQLCDQFVEYANCLPLALTVLGSSMCGRPIDVWKETLDKLQKYPNKEILENLEIGFHELDRNEKSMFLDIACFFVGKRIEYVLEGLRSCGFYPNGGINILVDKNLVTISKGILWMHHLLQEMGQEIIRRQSYVDAGKRSRLWQYEEICDVVSNNTGTERVEAIVLDGGKQGQVPRHLSGNALSKMRNLRLLKFKNIHLSKAFNTF